MPPPIPLPICRRIPPRAAALALFGLALALLGLSWSWAFAGEGEPGEPDEPEATEAPYGAPFGAEITPTPLIYPRQEQPVLPENPTMADLGHQTWWSVCMACHGDAGQGLTDEWRQTAFGEDKDCWTSKCHGKLHPPQGFEFPHIVPPAWGPGTLKRFVTADELHAYLLEKMPWWNPGSLSDMQAWELTAFIMQSNGALARRPWSWTWRTPASSRSTCRSQKTEDERGWEIVYIGLVGLFVIGLVALRSRRRPAVQHDTEAGRSQLAAERHSWQLKNHWQLKTTAAAEKPQLAAKRPSFFHHLHPPTIPCRSRACATRSGRAGWRSS